MGSSEATLANTFPSANRLFLFQTRIFTLLSGAVEYADSTSAERQDPFQTKYPGYDTKLLLMVRLQSGKCRVPIHCHYSQDHSDQDW